MFARTVYILCQVKYSVHHCHFISSYAVALESCCICKCMTFSEKIQGGNTNNCPPITTRKIFFLDKDLYEYIYMIQTILSYV